MKVEAPAPRLEAATSSPTEIDDGGAFAQTLASVDVESPARPAVRDLGFGLDARASSEDVESEADAEGAGEGIEIEIDVDGLDATDVDGLERWMPNRGKRSIFARAADAELRGAQRLIRNPGTRTDAHRPPIAGMADVEPIVPGMDGADVRAPLAQRGSAATGAGKMMGQGSIASAGSTDAAGSAPMLATEGADEGTAMKQAMKAPVIAASEADGEAAPARTPMSAPMTVSLQLATLAHDVVARAHAALAADAPTSTFEAMSAPKQPPVITTTPTGQDAFIHIDHPDLGRIRLQLQIEARSLRVRAIAQSVAAAAALRESEDAMRDDVARHGVDLDRLRVDIEKRRGER